MIRRALGLFFNDHCVWCRNIFCLVGTTAIMAGLAKTIHAAFAASLGAGFAACFVIMAVSLTIALIVDARAAR